MSSSISFYMHELKIRSNDASLIHVILFFLFVSIQSNAIQFFYRVGQKLLCHDRIIFQLKKCTSSKWPCLSPKQIWHLLDTVSTLSSQLMIILQVVKFCCYSFVQRLEISRFCLVSLLFDHPGPKLRSHMVLGQVILEATQRYPFFQSTYRKCYRDILAQSYLSEEVYHLASKLFR